MGSRGVKVKRQLYNEDASTPDVMSNNLLAVCEFASGTVSGILGAAVGHPMDTVKTRMQISQETSVTKTIANAYRFEGVPGFFKGFSFPVLSSGLLNAVFFGVYGSTLRQMLGGNQQTFCCEEPQLGPKQAEGFHWKVGLAGLIGGAASVVVGCPSECVKTKQQGDTTAYRHAIPVCKEIYQKYGMKGLFCGYWPMMYRNGLGFAVFIITYEHLLCYLEVSLGAGKKSPMVVNEFVSGGLAGCTFWAACMPFDVVKSRIQFDDPANPKYKGMIDCFRQSYRAEGLSVFFNGLGISMLRSIPVNAVIFTVYQFLMKGCRSAMNKDDAQKYFSNFLSTFSVQPKELPTKGGHIEERKNTLFQFHAC